MVVVLLYDISACFLSNLLGPSTPDPISPAHAGRLWATVTWSELSLHPDMQTSRVISLVTNFQTTLMLGTHRAKFRMFAIKGEKKKPPPFVGSLAQGLLSGPTTMGLEA